MKAEVTLRGIYNQFSLLHTSSQICYVREFNLNKQWSFVFGQQYILHNVPSDSKRRKKLGCENPNPTETHRDIG